MADKRLIKFIKEARTKGYEDYQIRYSLIKNSWTEDEIEEAFSSLKTTGKKTKVCVYIDSEMTKLLEKRAKKNMFTLPEQIEDILRRSCINLKKSQPKENIDDSLVSLFSKRKYKK